MGIIGAGLNGDKIIQTQEEIENNCIHVFKIIEESNENIKIKCIRCGKERILKG